MKRRKLLRETFITKKLCVTILLRITMPFKLKKTNDKGIKPVYNLTSVFKSQMCFSFPTELSEQYLEET